MLRNCTHLTTDRIDLTNELWIDEGRSWPNR